MIRTVFKLRKIPKHWSHWQRKCSNKSLNRSLSVSKKCEFVSDSNNETQKLILSTSQLKSTKSGESADFRKIVRRCSNLSSLLNEIRPHLNKLNSGDLECIFNQIIDIAFNLKHKKVAYHYTPYQNYVYTIKQSPEFRSLLNRTVELIDELDSGCLVRTFKVFDVTKMTPTNETMRLVLSKLSSKVEHDLNLDENVDFLKALNFYHRDNCTYPDYGILKLESALLQSAKNTILTNQIDKNNTALLAKCFRIFSNLRPDETDFEVVNHLVTILSTPENVIDFKSSVHLLKTLKQAMQHFHKDNHLSADELINKCNATICRTLSHRPTSEHVHFYCVNLHNFRDVELISKNFYDPQILSLIAPVIIRNIERHPQDRFLIYKTMLNFSKFEIYDEMLLRFFNSLISRKPQILTKLGVSNLFNLYSKYHLPFINYQHFAQLLFNENLQFEQNVHQATTGLTLLCQLILSGVAINELQFKRFDRLITDDMKSWNSLNRFARDHINLARLAKAYLSMFAKMEPRVKSMIETRMDQFIDNMREVVLMKVSGRYFKVDTRLSRDASLWNGGLFINQIAIFDKSINDLISLEKYSDCFDKVEQIQLDENQQLLVIMKRRRLRGNISGQYENTQNYRLKQIVGQLNFKPVELFVDDLQGLDLQDETNFVISQVLENCK